MVTTASLVVARWMLIITQTFAKFHASQQMGQRVQKNLKQKNPQPKMECSAAGAEKNSTVMKRKKVWFQKEQSNAT